MHAHEFPGNLKFCGVFLWFPPKHGCAYAYTNCYCVMSFIKTIFSSMPFAVTVAYLYQNG